MESKQRVKRIVLSELNRISNSENFANSTKETRVQHEKQAVPGAGKGPCSDIFDFGSPKSSSHLSNLELLTKVASRIRNDEDMEVYPEYVSENVHMSDTHSESTEASCKPRKEKSLSILCDKFMKLYPLDVTPGKSMEISLDQATQFIGTDRRRIYDILIVLECLQMASKVCKNHYQWHGTQHLKGTLSQLKWLAIRLGFFQNVNAALLEESSAMNEEYSKNLENPDVNNHAHLDDPASGSKRTKSKDQKSEEDSDIDLKDSSLGIMCQKFLMLFLVTSKVITLDNAAKILLGTSEGISKDCHKVKTKIRRLYDIANVLSSLELIKKVNVSAGNTVCSGSFIRLSKKPAFQYTGPEVEPEPLPDGALVSLQTTRHSLLGHPSHAASERRCTRKRKPRVPCPLLPRLINLAKGDSQASLELSLGQKRSLETAFAGEVKTSEREKFPRSHSENCIGQSPVRHGPLRSDILQVAELELQRLFQEEKQEKEKGIISTTEIDSTSVASKSGVTVPKCNWRHHHSENCINIGQKTNEVNGPQVFANSKPVSWRNSILKSSESRLNTLANTPKIVNVSKAVPTESNTTVRKDLSICIVKGSNSLAGITDGKLRSIGNEGSVPIVIHSVSKTSRSRSISINPVPISGSNCIVGPAYIIRHCPSDTSGNLNPVSISVTRMEGSMPNDLLLGGISHNGAIQQIT